MTTVRKMNAQEYGKDTLPEYGSLQYIKILEKAKENVLTKLKEISPPSRKLKELTEKDKRNLKEFLKRQRNGIKYYKGTSIFLGCCVGRAEELLTQKLEKDYIDDLSNLDDIDNAPLDDILDVIDSESPKWLEHIISHITKLTKEDLPDLHSVTISTEPVELLGYPEMYWIIGVGKDTKLDWINDIAEQALTNLKNPIKANFPEIALETDLNLLIQSDFTYEPTIEEVGISKFFKFQLPIRKEYEQDLVEGSKKSNI